MENSLKFFHVSILIICMILFKGNPSSGTESDILALLDLKKAITNDPFQIMSSWNYSINFCSWTGVKCNQSTKRVLDLNLSYRNLVASLPASIGNLTHITRINLVGNRFHGEIPQEIGRLQSLQHLNLSINSFTGRIPVNIYNCTQLRLLGVYSNHLVGSIPVQLASLLYLKNLWVDGNNLTGTIPPWIGNFSSLTSLFLMNNKLQGGIPNELGRLTSLAQLALGMNNLSGTVPSSIYNISSIFIFSLTLNQLHGELPHHIGTSLPTLEAFLGGGNKFTGAIPASLGNCSRLRVLDFGLNGFTGTLPAQSLGSLSRLVNLKFAGNSLGSGKTGDLNFLSFLANCTSLEVLALSGNQFGGELPESIANLSTRLNQFFVGGNLIHGSIPMGIGNLVNLTTLGLERNFLRGGVPGVIGKLQKLQGLYLNYNQFSGSIPSTLGNLTSLVNLYMNDNRFERSIPPSLGNCKSLAYLNLSSNNLTGTIPKELFGLSSLSISLSLANNFLTGLLPPEVGKLTNLGELDVCDNKLSGEIPATLGSCTSLVRLYLEGNTFEGTIPPSLTALRSLEEMNISRNNLSGKVPAFLGQFTFLKLLDLSHNDFEGELPKEGIFSQASGVSVVGNNKLCGGIPELLLPACSSKKPNLSRGLLATIIVIPIACVLAFIISLSCFIAARSKAKRGRHVTSPSTNDWRSGISYSELVESTDGFSTDNLIGSGSFGSVYKGVLPSDGSVAAIKVLNLQQHGASKSFIDECKALRSIRHRNLLKIITSCSSIDNQGNDFKCLVFEFMRNGSLELWLHPRDDVQYQRKSLRFIQRLNIAVDVASALEYLHYYCGTCIVHCDLKPSNILLDEDMVAHVGDFGLATFLFEPSNTFSQNHTMSVALKGSIGYIPPEYGMGGQVSILGDIYSYGILLLEMFTGKRPTDDIFKDGLSIHQLTAMALPHRVMDIVDPFLLLERIGNEDDDFDDIQEKPIAGNRPDKAGALEECLGSVMQIGLSCSTIVPKERMLMNVVVKKMNAIRDSYLKVM